MKKYIRSECKMTDTKELSLVKSENFGAVQCDFWENENKEVYMTREQVGSALGYTNPREAIKTIHSRNRDRLDRFSRGVQIDTPLGGTQNTTVYSSKGVYEICRFSRQPKADAFMDWVWDIVDNLRTGDLQISSGNATMSPAVVESKIQSILDEKFSSIENMFKAYEQHVDKRMDGMANSFIYIQKSLNGGDPFSKARITGSTKNWKDGAIVRVKKMIADNQMHKPVGVVLKQVYTKMRNVYGIVFEQELKEYRDKYNVETKQSVLELINQKESLRSLFDNILPSVANSADKTVVSTKTFPVVKKPCDIMRESISPLIIMYNDNTKGGNATYQKVYNNMCVGWDCRKTRYMNSHHLKNRPSKFKLVETDSKLLKLFAKTVNSMLDIS